MGKDYNINFNTGRVIDPTLGAQQALGNISDMMEASQRRSDKRELQAKEDARYATQEARAKAEYDYKVDGRAADDAARAMLADPLTSIGDFNPVFANRMDQLGYKQDSNGDYENFSLVGAELGDPATMSPEVRASYEAKMKKQIQVGGADNDAFIDNETNKLSLGEVYARVAAANPNSKYAQDRVLEDGLATRAAGAAKEKAKQDLTGKMIAAKALQASLDVAATSTTSSGKISDVDKLRFKQAEKGNIAIASTLGEVTKAYISKNKKPLTKVQKQAMSAWVDLAKSKGMRPELIRNVLMAGATDPTSKFYFLEDKAAGFDPTALFTDAQLKTYMNSPNDYNYDESIPTASGVTSAQLTARTKAAANASGLQSLEAQLKLLNRTPAEVKKDRLDAQSREVLKSLGVEGAGSRIPTGKEVSDAVKQKKQSSTVGGTGKETISTPDVSVETAGVSVAGTVTSVPTKLETNILPSTGNKSTDITAFNALSDEQKVLAYQELRTANPEGWFGNSKGSKASVGATGESFTKAEFTAGDMLAYMKADIDAGDLDTKVVNMQGERGRAAWKAANPDLDTKLERNSASIQAMKQRLSSEALSRPGMEPTRIALTKQLKVLEDEGAGLVNDFNLINSTSVADIDAQIKKVGSYTRGDGLVQGNAGPEEIRRLINLRAEVVQANKRNVVPTSYEFSDAGAETVAIAKRNARIAEQDQTMSDASMVLGGTRLANEAFRVGIKKFTKEGIDLAARKARGRAVANKARMKRVNSKVDNEKATGKYEINPKDFEKRTPDEIAAAASKKKNLDALNLKAKQNKIDKDFRTADRRANVESSKNDVIIAETKFISLKGANRARYMELKKEADAVGLSVKEFAKRQLKFAEN